MSADWDEGKGVRMPVGMGVIRWRDQIVVYQLDGEDIAWARQLGSDTLPLSEELRDAIRADRSGGGD